MKMNVDDRGSFTELVHTEDCGQVSINISKPGITKGQHWHNSKWELFIVVAGHGLIQERNINTGETVELKEKGSTEMVKHYSEVYAQMPEGEIDDGYGMFLTMLEYKLKDKGGKLIKEE